MNTDVTELKRYIQVPGEVVSCEWQTGKFAPHGGDWWLAAVLDVPADEIDSFLQGPATTEVFETPPGLRLESAFAELESFPGAQTTEAPGIRLITETWSAAPYARSPLVNGKVIRLSETRVLLLLFTI